MTEQPKTNLEGFAFVLQAARQKLGDKAPKGVHSWLAGNLGVSRQTIHAYGKGDGIPAAMVPKVARLLNAAPGWIRPETGSIRLPSDLFYEIAAIARKRRMTLDDVAVELLRKSLRS